MYNLTIITILAGSIFLSTLSITKAQETSVTLNDVAQESDDDIDVILEADGDDMDMILRDYHVIPLENQSEVSLYVGFDYTQGDYGNLTKTKMSYIPISLNYTVEAWRFRVSSGYVSVTGEENIIPGTGLPTLLIGPAIDNTAQNSNNGNSNNGIGDIFLSGSYAFHDFWANDFWANDLWANDLYIDITAQVKIPTANVENGLSTGKTDFSLQISVARFISDFLPFATVGYRYIGKTNRYDLQNIWFASLGMAYYLNHNMTLGISYDLRKSVNVNTANLQELQAYMDYRFSKNWGAYFYGIAGLSDSSPNIGGGFQLKYNF